MKDGYSDFLKQLAVVTLFSGFFPLVYLINYCLLGNIQIEKSLVLQGLLLVGGYGAYIGAWIRQEMKEKNYAKTVRIILSVIYGSILTLLILWGILWWAKQDVVALIGFVAIAGAIGCLGIGAYRKDWVEVIAPMEYGVLLVMIFFGSLFVPIGPCILVAAYVTAVFAFLRNQSILPEFLERTEKNVMISREIQIGNAVFLGIIIIVFIMGYFLKDEIINLVATTLKGMIYLVVWVIGSLMSLDSQGRSETTPEVNGRMKIYENIPKDTFFEIIINSAFIILLLVLILTVCLKNRRQLLAVLNKGITYVKRVILRLISGEKTEQNREYRAYYDEVDTITKMDKKSPLVEQASSYKRWHKKFKSYKKKARREGHYSEGYYLLKEALQLRKVKIGLRDTPLMIVEKSKKYGYEELEHMIWQYQCITYGQNVLSQVEMQELIGLLEKLDNDLAIAR